MGAEIRLLLGPLVGFARGQKVTVAPIKGPGASGGPNKDMARTAGQLLAGHPGAIDRAWALFREMDEKGDSCTGEGCDLYAPSHMQIVHGGKAGILLGAVRAGDDALVKRAAQSFRVTTAALPVCHFTDRDRVSFEWEGRRCQLTPDKQRAGQTVVFHGGPRALDLRDTEGAGPRELVPVLRCSASDKLCRLLVYNERVRVPDDEEQARTDVAVELVQAAMREGGITVQQLLGGQAELDYLRQRFGYHQVGKPGRFYCWFQELPGANQAEVLWGGGFDGRQLVLRWDRQQAIDDGQRFERGEEIAA
jgi:hypothetical protein